MKKRILSVILAFCMMLTILPVQALAWSGACGPNGNVAFTLSNDVVTFSGTGKLNAGHYIDNVLSSSGTLPWSKQRTAIIGSGITCIGALTFYTCTALTSVTIPTSVTSIEPAAFIGCTGLRDVYYGGTEAQWKNISIDNSKNGNDALLNATIHCTPISYTVTYSANGGSGTMTAQTFTQGKAQNLKTNTFTRSGYRFIGWNTQSNGSGTTYSDGQSITLSTNLTLYAQWQAAEIAVTFDANGGTGTMNAQTFTQGVAQNLKPNTFTRSGYRFIGWTTQSNGSGTSYSDKESVTLNANLTLYAQWQAAEVTVTFDANGGNGTMTAQTFTQGVAQNLKTNTFTRAGYRFIGWNTQSDGSGTSYSDKESVTLNANLTLYAQWQAAEIAVTVTFDANGGTGTMTAQTFTKGEAQNLKTNTFTRSGYRFAGWNTQSDGSGTSYSDGQSITVSANLTLYAQWQAAEVAVTFDANGGTGTMTAQNFTQGAEQNLKTNTFTRSGYNFTGWNTQSNGSGTSYSDGQRITLSANLTLYAQWEAATYTVTFLANGGEPSISTKNVVNGRSYGDLPTVTRSNYRFDGWFTSASGGTQITSGTTVNLTADQTLYAHWITDPTQKEWQYFRFSNSSSDFFRAGETENYNAGKYFDSFGNVLTQYYQSSSAAYYLSRLRNKQSSKWSGSCYGIAALEGMVNHNLLSPGAIDSDADSLPSVDMPRDNTGVRNLLNYYYLTQFIPALRSKLYQIGTSASAQALSKMASDVIGGTPHMFSYFFDGGGHSIILEGGKRIADGSYELVGQDNRLHGYTICEKVGSGWRDTGEPVTVTVKIPGNYSSCRVLLNPNTYFTRDGYIYRGDIDETVTEFEPVSVFSHFASADPTGTAVHAQLFSEATDSPSVFYYDPEGEDVASFTLKYSGVNIESDTMASNEHVKDFWYTIGGATNTAIAGTDGIFNLEMQNAPPGIMAILDTNPNEEYTISDMGSGTFSYAGADGFASVDVTNAESAIIDLTHDSVILIGNKGDFNIAVADENQTVTTVSGSAAGDDIRVSSSGNGIELAAPAGSYTVTFAEADGQETTTSIVSNGREIHVEAPVSSPVVCGKYASVFTAEISRNSSGFTFTLTSRGAAPVPKTITAWQATYDENNKMVKMDQLSSEQAGNSMRFSGTVSDGGKCKLFVLDETFAPVIEKYSLN